MQAYDIVRGFEERIADYAGARAYAVRGDKR